MQLRIDFDRNDGRRPFGDQRGQRPGAGADFQHDILRRNLGRLGQQPQQVQIGKKILPMLRLERIPTSANRRLRNEIVWFCEVNSTGPNLPRARTPRPSQHTTSPRGTSDAVAAHRRWNGWFVEPDAVRGEGRGTREAEAGHCLISSFFVPSPLVPRPAAPRAFLCAARPRCLRTAAIARVGCHIDHAKRSSSPPPPVGAGRCSCFPHCMNPYAAKGP